MTFCNMPVPLKNILNMRIGIRWNRLFPNRWLVVKFLSTVLCNQGQNEYS